MTNRGNSIFFWPYLMALVLSSAPLLYAEDSGMVLPHKEAEEVPRKKSDIFTRIYLLDFEKVWNIVIQETKQYEYAYQDKETGMLKTRWVDNTEEEQFYNPEEASLALASKFQVLMVLKKGFWKNRPATKLGLYKKQRIFPAEEQKQEKSREPLAFRLNPTSSEGWISNPTDGVLEKTILYRISRVVSMEKMIMGEREMIWERYPFP